MKRAALLFSLIALSFVSCQDLADKFKKKVAENVPGIEKDIVKIEELVKDMASDGSNTISWLRYPSISPDGREIAFSFMGDIYITSVKGGYARPLTHASSFESAPVWSNDGKNIAFLSDRHGNHDVFIISVNGGEAKRLTHHSANDIPLTFSPDDSKIYFSSARAGSKESSAFPTGGMPQLFSVSVNGGNDFLEIPLPVFDLRISKDGKRFVYHDKKGYENEWRKHHTSSVTRDIWEYLPEDVKFNKISNFSGEDRSPAFSPDETAVYYLSEKSGSFNVWKIDSGKVETQITKFDTHPVRFLSASRDGTLCFSYHGDIYTMKEGSNPQKLEIFSPKEIRKQDIRQMLQSVTDMAISPDGTEAALVMRGEIYVINPETGTTKRITQTPNEERWVSFHPDGRKLLYSSFRNGSWNIYETVLEDENELYFFASTKMTEKPLIEGKFNTFQPGYSPDGKKVAYLRERTELVVYDTEKNLHTTVLSGDRNISYVDGDQEFTWSPDSSRLAVVFLDRDLWSGEIGIVSSDGRGPVVNITNSGSDDTNPKWSSNGEMISWFNHGEITAFFMNRSGRDNFFMTKEEFDIKKKRDEKKKENEIKEKASSGNSKDKDEKKPDPVNFETEKIEKRIVKLSLNPANYLDHTFSSDSETLYFMIMEPAEYKIISLSMREKKDKLIASIPRPRNLSYWEKPEFSIILDKTGSSLFAVADNRTYKITVADGKMKPLAPAAELSVNFQDEKFYLFEHVWKTVNDKFYVAEMHNVDWKKYFNEYVKFIPFINNNYDFTELLSEMLGELNASHTGSGYIPQKPLGDDTGRLGIFFSYSQRGLIVDEVMTGSPLDKAGSRIKTGTVIEQIDGISTLENNFDSLLNRKAGRNVRLSLLDPETSNRWEEVVKPVPYRAEFDLLYTRWVEKNRERVEILSKGRLGYVHIRGMNGQSFKEIYNDILGRYNDREGIVVDTRFNGGGWLHNELSILFSGKSYTRYSHRGVKNFGGDPNNQWTKKTVLVVNEGNYSDAHLFPHAYKTLKLGKIVGMPVAGTSTAVWWPSMLDSTMYFGIPQIGIRDTDDNHLENSQLEPDYLVPVSPEQYIRGEDPQIEKAVKVLLEN
ncbi:MAG TPA: S41 family peptidase [bacterium]|nr:S41 family peptidase [bacterium]